MIEVRNVRIALSDFGCTPEQQDTSLRRALARVAHLRPADIASVKLYRRSVDARHNSNIQLVCTLRATLTGGLKAESKVLRDKRNRSLSRVHETPYVLPSRTVTPIENRPVVVGAGCAGLFCALALANAGLEPLLVERGDATRERTRACNTFAATGTLDPESNIQFGLGGAGTFSDGKLTTGTKSPTHRFILETFVAGGASPDILVDAHPHMGSDVLPGVVEYIRARIETLGGEVRLRCRLTDIEMSAGHVLGVVLARRDTQSGRFAEQRVATSSVVLACGHSARDVYKLLQTRHVALERKPFAMGVRIEHLQQDIDKVLWGRAAGNPVLGAASYKLAHHLRDGRGVFSFCMCPGGSVVAAASEDGGVVTNGMSLAARDGTNANAGILCEIKPTDLLGSNILAGIDLQRSCEQRAFEAGGGGFVAPAQLVGDFLSSVASRELGEICPSYPLGVSLATLDGMLPDYVLDGLREALPHFDTRLPGFCRADAVLTGVETRSSSPVRVVRGSDLQSVSTRGLWPAGEGAGYAGGIMSAASDGLRVAEAVIGSTVAN